MHLGHAQALVLVLLVVRLSHEVYKVFEGLKVFARLTGDEEDLGLDPETEAGEHGLDGFEKRR